MFKKSIALILVSFLLITLVLFLKPTTTPDVVGLIDNQVVVLNKNDIQNRYFTSHGNIPTLEGLVVDINEQNPVVHLMDTKQHQGHFDYAKPAFKFDSTYTFRDFRNDVIHPNQHKYLPFTLYDLSSATHSIKWVLQIRRYDFKDNEQDFAQLSKQLMQLIGDKVFNNSKGALLVYVSDNISRRPNTFHLEHINKLDIHTLTELQLLQIANAQLVSILNNQPACGYLKIHTGDLSDSRLNRLYNNNDIVIFKDIPQRIPVLAGIITLTPQTPLSHINLLAINRGTLNVSASSLDQLLDNNIKNDLVYINQFIDKQQLVSVIFNNLTNKIDIQPIDQTQFNLCQTQKPAALSVPNIDNTLINSESLHTTLTRFKHPIDSSSETTLNLSINTIGAKASHYATFKNMVTLDSNIIREAFALDFSLYFYVIQQTQTQALIDNLLSNKHNLDKSQIQQSLKDIRTRIQSFKPDTQYKQLLTHIRAQVNLLMPNAIRIRLRSSTNAEDLKEFNGAGLYESKGFNLNDSDNKLNKQLLKVLASLWLERAYWEREYYQIQHKEVAMAILINEAFSDEVANGVLMIKQLKSGKFEILINAQSGENSITNPLPNQIPESFVFKQYIDDPGWAFVGLDLISMSNIKSVFLLNTDFIDPKQKKTLNTLSNNSLLIFKQLLSDAQITNTKQYSVDIEFKVMLENNQQQVYIKQGRLIKKDI